MKKKLLIATGAALALIVAAVIFLIIHGTGSTISVMLYYPDENETSLASHHENISFTDPAHIPANIIEELQKKGGISRECSINTVEFDGSDRISIDFSEEFLSDKSHVNVLRVYAIVKSICSISHTIGITEVRVTADGAPVTASDGKRLGYLSDSSINIMNSEEIMTYECELYFLNKDGVLQPEIRKIDAANGTIEYNVVKALIEGPETRELSKVFSPGTRLLSAETWDGICYVNFRPLPKSTNLAAVRSSLIYTLSSLEGIEKVQLLIDGKITN